MESKCDPCEFKLPNTQRPQDLTIWNYICSETALVGECQEVWWERCCTFLRQRTRWNSDLIQDGKSFVPDLSRECKLIAVFHGYFSVSHPTYILCLKAQTSTLQRSLKTEQDPPQVYLHMIRKERQKYSVYGSCKRDLFFNQWLYLYTIFICSENKPAELRVRNRECTVCTQLKATMWHWEPWRNKK